MTAKFVDYYEILAIDPRADVTEIKAAYRACMLRDHVDQNPDDPRAATRTIMLAQAKQILLDDQQRRSFDQQRGFWLATRRLHPHWQPASSGPSEPIEIDLRDVSLGKLLVGAGVAVVLSGLFFAAQAVADRQSRRRR